MCLGSDRFSPGIPWQSQQECEALWTSEPILVPFCQQGKSESLQHILTTLINQNTKSLKWMMLADFCSLLKLFNFLKKSFLLFTLVKESGNSDGHTTARIHQTTSILTYSWLTCYCRCFSIEFAYHHPPSYMMNTQNSTSKQYFNTSRIDLLM